MIFTSLSFLIFIAILFAILAVVQKDRPRQYILLVASYIFYGWWNITFLLLIISCSFIAWWVGLKIEQATEQKQRKLYLQISLVCCLGALIFFKYANFLVSNISLALGMEMEQNLGILLPVGISFFTFQALSYTIDLYRNNIKVCKDPVRFFLYIAFFPQLVAGPIVRASDFLPQLDRPVRFNRTDLIIGAQIFLGGTLQKVIIADNLSTYVDPIFAEPQLYATSTLWLGVAAYTIQIFGDFAGYSLMAIGISRMLGYRLPPNFDMPYLSFSITEFWRRWHMSLSSWLRDYLYVFSLGGNRSGTIRTYINLMATMLIGGLWHGASWNFVFWGFLHGSALVLHKLWCKATSGFESTKANPLYKLAAWATTLWFVMMCWIPFRSPSFDNTLYILKNLYRHSEGIMWLKTPTIWVLITVIIWHLAHQFSHSLLKTYPRKQLSGLGSSFVIVFCLFLIAMFAPTDASPFIYFQF